MTRQFGRWTEEHTSNRENVHPQQSERRQKAFPTFKVQHAPKVDQYSWKSELKVCSTKIGETSQTSQCMKMQLQNFNSSTVSRCTHTYTNITFHRRVTIGTMLSSPKDEKVEILATSVDFRPRRKASENSKVMAIPQRKETYTSVDLGLFIQIRKTTTCKSAKPSIKSKENKNWLCPVGEETAQSNEKRQKAT